MKKILFIAALLVFAFLAAGCETVQDEWEKQRIAGLRDQYVEWRAKQIAPTLAIVAPAQSRSSSVIVQASTNVSSTVTITANGQVVGTGTGTQVAIPVSLKDDGAHQLQAKNQACYIVPAYLTEVAPPSFCLDASAETEVFVDTLPPVIKKETEVSYDDNGMSISGQATDATTKVVSVQAAGVTGEVRPDGSFTARVPYPALRGMGIVPLQVFDSLGNETQKPIAVHKTAPVIASAQASPEGDSMLIKGKVTSQTKVVSVIVGGQYEAQVLSDGTFTVKVPYAEINSDVVLAQASDAIGNISSPAPIKVVPPPDRWEKHNSKGELVLIRPMPTQDYVPPEVKSVLGVWTDEWWLYLNGAYKYALYTPIEYYVAAGGGLLLLVLSPILVMIGATLVRVFRFQGAMMTTMQSEMTTSTTAPATTASATNQTPAPLLTEKEPLALPQPVLDQLGIEIEQLFERQRQRGVERLLVHVQAMNARDQTQEKIR